MNRYIRYLLYWLVALLLASGIFCLFFFISVNYSLIGYMNALLFSGVITIGSLGLLYVYRWGAFDMLVYGIGDIFWHMNPSKNKIAKYDDYGDYREKKKEARSKNKFYFWPFLVIGFLAIAASIILRVVFYVQNGF